MKNEFPNYVLHRKYEKFIFFHNETILSEFQNEIQNAFIDFLSESQNSTLIYFISELSNDKIELDFKNYKKVIDDCYSNTDNDNFLSKITESPDIWLLGSNYDWEYYSNGLFNISILGFNQDLTNLVNKFFSHLLNNSDLAYSDAQNYIDLNYSLLKREDIELFLKNYQ